MNICTIICGNYLAQARVIARSFAEHFPEDDCVVLVVDADPETTWSEPFPVVTLADLSIPDVDVMAGIYDPIELSTAVKPWLLSWMLQQYGDLGPVAYFDPDIRFFSQMPELEAMLERHGIVLTPHLASPMPLDDEQPSEQAILLAGTYNLGFIALRAGRSAEDMLEWWKQRLSRGCVVDPERGFFVDQRYMDFVPGLFDDVGILRHEGYNVAYWNLATRRIVYRDETYRVNDEPLRFFHFSGFDPRRPESISKHQTRIPIDREPALAELYADYAEALMSSGFLESCGEPYGFSTSWSSRRITTGVRTLYRGLVEDGFRGSLFNEEGDEAFAARVAAPDARFGDIPLGLSLLWDSDTDLRQGFPDVGHADRAAFLAWCASESVGSEYLGGYLDTGTSDGRGVRRRTQGVNVVGYLHAELGVGEAARSAISLLDDTSTPVWPVSINAHGSRNDHPFRVPGGRADLPFSDTLLCVNADMVPSEAEKLAGAGLRSTRVTGFWWWETEDFPARFDAAFEWVDRVICGSSFVAAAIERRGSVPVSWFPLPVEVGPVAASIPAVIPWPDGFVFYFAFDYASVFARKNPLGLVQAYTSAFDSADGAALLIKSVNAERFPEQHSALRAAAAGRPDVVLFDGFVDSSVRNAMTAACDCYVSLHRSEGFGLTIAEAMYLGKPVIATGYSGNMDFMNSSNSIPVPFEMTAIGEGAGPYPAHGSWAEPDLGAAADAMRAIFDDSRRAESLGLAAAASIRTTHSHAAAGEALLQVFNPQEVIGG